MRIPKSRLIVIAILLIIAYMLFSCAGESKSSIQDGDFKIELLFEKDGCKMYRFKDVGRYVYWSDCEGRTSYSSYYNSGKSSYSIKVESLTNK